MCFGMGRPKSPKLPPPPPVDSRIEETAEQPVVGDKRKSKTKSRKKAESASKTTKKRYGTDSLQIPLLSDSNNSSDLNYTS